MTRSTRRPGAFRQPTALRRPPACGFRIERPAAELTSTETGSAAVYLFDAIDAWGSPWGVSASEFVAQLQQLNVSAIDLHLNSPGGDYFEAVTIHNALLQHPAQVTVYVDGMAASAASVVAMAGERLVMGVGAQLMIHNSRTIAIGTAEDMRASAELLDGIDNDIAGFYARRAKATGVGTSAEAFLEAMAVETWYAGAAAVAAGLADEYAGAAKAEPDEDEPEHDPDEMPHGDDGPPEDEAESMAGMAAAMAPDRWVAAMQAWRGPTRQPTRPAANHRPPRAAPAGRTAPPAPAIPINPQAFRNAIRRAHP